MLNDEIVLLPANTVLAKRVLDYYTRNRSFLEEFEPNKDDSFFTPQCIEKMLSVEELSFGKGLSYRFYIALKSEPDKIIGLIGLNNIVYGAFLSAHLGYKLDKDHINKGLMTKAVSMITQFAFEEVCLHRIEANVMPKNVRSIRVLEKNGYVNEGLSKKYLKINGKWEDHIHMVKLNEDMQ